MSNSILIIDDEIDFCQILKSYFRKRAREISVAHSLREGIAMLKEIKPAVLFLDNNLPDGHGWDELGNIVEIIPQSKIYLVSAHRSASSVERNNKNITIWEKPISLEMLAHI